MSIVTAQITCPASPGFSSAVDLSAIEDMQVQELFSGSTGVLSMQFSNDLNSPTNWFEALRETTSGTTGCFTYKIAGRVFTFGNNAVGPTKGTVEIPRARWVRMQTVSGGTGSAIYTFFGLNSPGLATDITLSAPTSVSATAATPCDALEDIIVQDVYSAYTGTVNLETSVDGTNWFPALVVVGVASTGTTMYRLKGQVLLPTAGEGIIEITRCNYVRLNSTAYTSGTASFRFTGKVRI